MTKTLLKDGALVTGGDSDALEDLLKYVSRMANMNATEAFNI